MATVVFCSGRPAAAELGSTVLFRAGIEREEFPNLPAAQNRLNAGGVALLIVEKTLPGLDSFLKNLRKSPTLKRTSVGVLSRDGFDPNEIELLSSGANAILRLPADDEFDRRVSSLIEIPPRRDIRVPVQLQIEALAGFGSTVPVLALNISISGMLVESSYELSVGDDISIASQLVENSGQIFRATGKIVRRTPRGQFGIRFADIVEGENSLRAYIDSNG
jgi:DNA-binding response OmpR family regulator